MSVSLLSLVQKFLRVSPESSDTLEVVDGASLSSQAISLRDTSGDEGYAPVNVSSQYGIAYFQEEGQDGTIDLAPASGMVYAKQLLLSGAPGFTSNPLAAPLTTPASATAGGLAGTINWDANYIYVCTSNNNWKRVAIATW